jgi:hypothetical protein
VDEEDIAVPSGSLNNRLGVVYEASQPGTYGWKRLRRFTMRSDTWRVPQGKPLPSAASRSSPVQLGRYQNTRGGNNVEFSWAGGCSVGVEEGTGKSSQRT